MAVCDYRDDKIVPVSKRSFSVVSFHWMYMNLLFQLFCFLTQWAVPELQGKIKVQLLMRNQFKGHSRKWAYRDRTEVEESYRTPAYMAYYLRMAISDNKKCLATPCNPQTMTRFNGLIDGLMQGYQGQIRLVGLGFAPFPSKFI